MIIQTQEKWHCDSRTYSSEPEFANDDSTLNNDDSNDKLTLEKCSGFRIGIGYWQYDAAVQTIGYSTNRTLFRTHKCSYWQNNYRATCFIMLFTTRLKQAAKQATWFWGKKDRGHLHLHQAFWSSRRRPSCSSSRGSRGSTRRSRSSRSSTAPWRCCETVEQAHERKQS